MTSYGFATDGTTIVSDFEAQVNGRVFLVTGPSKGGVGADTAITLAHGSPSTILLLGRSLVNIQPTLDSIHAINSSIVTKLVPVNLNSMSSVRSAASTILNDTSIPRIDVMINNAGGWGPYAMTEDGLESTFATNHLSHFLLTKLLMPKILSAAPDARIINISSWGHFTSDVRYEDVGFNNGKDYSTLNAYGQSKTANVLFSVELNKKLNKKGVTSFAVHPGSVETNLLSNITPEMMQEGVKFLNELGLPFPETKTSQQGCATTLRAALDPSLETDGSVYLADCQLSTDPLVVKPYALDEKNARRCWALSENLVKEKFEC